jgi:hypothetical protein
VPVGNRFYGSFLGVSVQVPTVVVVAKVFGRKLAGDGEEVLASVWLLSAGWSGW